jgi:ATP-binding cassette subfamily B protein
MKKLLALIKTYYHFLTQKRIWFSLFILALILQAIASSVSPYFYKLFVDTIPTLDYQRLIKILIAVTGVGILNMILRSIAHVLGDNNLIDASVRARTEVVQKIQELDFAYHTTKSTGSLISAIKRGDGAFFSLFHTIHFQILTTFVSFLVMIYSFSRLDFRIAAVIVGSIIVSLITARFIVAYNYHHRKLFLKLEDKISAVIVDNMVNFETVKYFAQEKHELKRLAKHFKAWVKRLWTFANSFRVFDIALTTISILTSFLVLFLSLRMTVSDQMTLGNFILVTSFMSLVYPRLFQMIWNFRGIAKDYADIEKYFRVFKYEVQIKDPEKPLYLKEIDGEIEFDKVSFSYKEGKKDAVKKFSLKIRQGQSVALVGKSGSGKTTLMKLLMRFYDVDQGQITLDRINIKKFTKSHLRSFMGVVPQEPVMFNHTIGYNIGYGNPKLAQKEIVAAAKIANLHDFIQTLPKKYQTNVGERGIKLSGGQKQRLAIARMVLSDPEIIIFDEATSQLDSENERQIQEALWKVAKDKTMIIIAHRLSTAMRADKIIILEEGEIIETGSHQSLLKRKNSFYKYLWELQVNPDQAIVSEK